MQAMQRNPTVVLPSQQRLHELCFLQKMGCQKPCWDQARLSSLVNKQVEAGGAGEKGGGQVAGDDNSNTWEKGGGVDKGNRPSSGLR